MKAGGLSLSALTGGRQVLSSPLWTPVLPRVLKRGKVMRECSGGLTEPCRGPGEGVKARAGGEARWAVNILWTEQVYVDHARLGKVPAAPGCFQRLILSMSSGPGKGARALRMGVLEGRRPRTPQEGPGWGTGRRGGTGKDLTAHMSSFPRALGPEIEGTAPL